MLTCTGAPHKHPLHLRSRLLVRVRQQRRVCLSPSLLCEYALAGSLSYRWLALILPTLINGQSYESYLQEHICAPIGLKRTSFFPFDGKWEGRLLPTRWGFVSEKQDKIDWHKMGDVDEFRARLMNLPRRYVLLARTTYTTSERPLGDSCREQDVRPPVYRYTDDTAKKRSNTPLAEAASTRTPATTRASFNTS